MIEIELKQIICPNYQCGVSVWVVEGLKSHLYSSKRTFYCVNGHPISFQGESDASKIKHLEKEKQEILFENNQKIFELKEELAKKYKNGNKKHSSKKERG